MARTLLFDTLRRALGEAWAAERGAPAPDAAPEAFRRWEISRRALLQGAAASVPLALARCSSADSSPSSSARVAVVGAGIAGLHCAYRLDQAGVDVRVFESSGRAGGRMYSARGMYAGGQVAELGGELIDTGHATLHALAMELGIQLDDLFTGEPAGFHRDTWYFDSRLVEASEIVTAFRPLAARMAAAVTAAEADMSVYASTDQKNIGQWLDDNDADPLIRNVLVNAYIGEYGLEIDQQSIFNLLYLIDYEAPDPFRIFGHSDERFHTHLGNDTFPTALATALGDRVVLERALVAVAQRAAGGYTLTFSQSGGGMVEESADHVVFALPFTRLRQVDLRVTLPNDKLRAIRELGYGTNAKLMSGYQSRVWRVSDNASGSAITDNGLQFLWETSRGQSGDGGILTNFVGGQAGLDIGDGTPEAAMQARLGQVDAIFPGTAAAYVANSAVRMHWPTHPHTLGSYACYKPGQWTAFYTGAVEGRREGNLHFCGEHCSQDFQGFMEGGAETGAMAAAEILDDLGLGMTPALLRAVGPRLSLPQGSYHGDARAPMTWMQRRRILRGAVKRAA